MTEAGMADAASTAVGRTSLRRRVRLVSGCVLFAYVLGHLANLALGLHSVALADAARPWFMLPWHNVVGQVLLYGSLLAHMLFGFEAIYSRRTLAMPAFDAVQLLMAVALPPMMLLHIMGTRGAFNTVGLDTGYDLVLTFYWQWAPVNGLRQVGVVLLAWLHGCMGLYYWLRLQPAWPRLGGWIYPLAFIVPVLALLGFVEAGKDVLLLAEDPRWVAALRDRAAVMARPEAASMMALQGPLILGYFGVLVVVLVARGFRERTRGGNFIAVRYIDGPSVEVRGGLSLLEMSRAAHVEHAALCGGRARCGTCRVRVVDGAGNLPDPAPLESETLARIGAAENVRLACQCLPRRGPLTIERLVPPDASAEELHLPDKMAESTQ